MKDLCCLCKILFLFLSFAKGTPGIAGPPGISGLKGDIVSPHTFTSNCTFLRVDGVKFF